MVGWLFFRSVGRGVALCLIALALLPWTSPFATLDAGSGAPALECPKAKTTHDDALPVPMPGSAALAARPLARCRPPAGTRIRGRASRHAILRI